MWATPKRHCSRNILPTPCTPRRRLSGGAAVPRSAPLFEQGQRPHERPRDRQDAVWAAELDNLLLSVRSYYLDAEQDHTTFSKYVRVQQPRSPGHLVPVAEVSPLDRPHSHTVRGGVFGQGIGDGGRKIVRCRDYMVDRTRGVADVATLGRPGCHIRPIWQWHDYDMAMATTTTTTIVSAKATAPAMTLASCHVLLLETQLRRISFLHR